MPLQLGLTCPNGPLRFPRRFTSVVVSGLALATLSGLSMAMLLAASHI